MKPTAKEYVVVAESLLTASRAVDRQMLDGQWQDKKGNQIGMRELILPTFKGIQFAIRYKGPDLPTLEESRDFMNELGDAVASIMESALTDEWMDMLTGEIIYKGPAMVKLGMALNEASQLNERASGGTESATGIEDMLTEMISAMLKGTGAGFTIKKINLADLFKDEPNIAAPAPGASPVVEEIAKSVREECNCPLCQILGKAGK